MATSLKRWKFGRSETCQLHSHPRGWVNSRGFWGVVQDSSLQLCSFCTAPAVLKDALFEQNDHYRIRKDILIACSWSLGLGMGRVLRVHLKVTPINRTTPNFLTPYFNVINGCFHEGNRRWLPLKKKLQHAHSFLGLKTSIFAGFWGLGVRVWGTFYE